MYELPTFPCFYPLLTTSKSIDFTGFLTNLLSSKFLLYNHSYFFLNGFVVRGTKSGIKMPLTEQTEYTLPAVYNKC